MLFACLFCAPFVLDKIRTLRTTHALRRQQITIFAHKGFSAASCTLAPWNGWGWAPSRQTTPASPAYQNDRPKTDSHRTIGPSARNFSTKGETAARRRAMWNRRCETSPKRGRNVASTRVCRMFFFHSLSDMSIYRICQSINPNSQDNSLQIESDKEIVVSLYLLCNKDIKGQQTSPRPPRSFRRCWCTGCRAPRASKETKK